MDLINMILLYLYGFLCIKGHLWLTKIIGTNAVLNAFIVFLSFLSVSVIFYLVSVIRI